MSEFRVGGLLFTSKFDSGNLAHVEKAQQSLNSSNFLPGGDHEFASNGSPSYPTGASGQQGSNSNQLYGDQQSPQRSANSQGVTTTGGYPSIQPDLEVNCWTRRDAAGTEFENGNRTWFYFAVKGAPQGKYVKMNLMNLNRQFRLFQQGMTPVYRVLPQKPNWDRIREKPSYMNIDENDFMVSFCHRFEFKNSSVEFAFCYPFSYTEYQKWMTSLDAEFAYCKDLPPLTTRVESPDKIYYSRELAIRSLDGNRVDLMTISSYDGICEEREHMLPHMFPDCETHQRPYRFRHKRVFFLSSRVHPGETPSSFVFNGFLKFILRPDDPRAIALRKRFVFKLMPMLNPDGVIRGHYRTDSRGVNLNRVYLDPDVTYHSPIYAARKILFYHHVFNAVNSTMTSSAESMVSGEGNASAGGSDKENHNLTPGSTTQSKPVSQNLCSVEAVDADEILCACIIGKAKANVCPKKEPPLEKIDDLSFLGSVGHKNSGIAYYVDLHGHASKRGCFMYGNHVENLADHVENLLYPKIISLNSAHFDFGGCNFTEKNMYMKDKRDGASKEGAGRVAMYKILGLIHSYTLECNYNTGRQTNSIAAATMDDGRATPPPPVSFPPRYSIYHYEDVGKAVAVSALDMLHVNPWSRISMSEYLNVQSCRLWVHRFVQGLYNGPGVPRKTQLKNSPASKLMAQSYLSNFDKDSVDGSSNSLFSRNRFALRSNRLNQTGVASSDPAGGLGSSGGVSGFSSAAASVYGVGGVTGGTSSSSQSGNQVKMWNGSSVNSNSGSAASNATPSKYLGPIRENKAFQMRRQRLLQLSRPSAASTQHNPASTQYKATGGVHDSSTTPTPTHLLTATYTGQSDTPMFSKDNILGTSQPKHVSNVNGYPLKGLSGNASLNNPPTNRTLYSIPVTTTTNALAQSLDASSALAYLSKQAASNISGWDNSGTIAGLAIVSPRKAHALVQKDPSPTGLPPSSVQFTNGVPKGKVLINRSLSLMQSNASRKVGNGNLAYSSAGNTSNGNSTAFPSKDIQSVYAAFERQSATPNSLQRPMSKNSYSHNDLVSLNRTQQDTLVLSQTPGAKSINAPVAKPKTRHLSAASLDGENGSSDPCYDQNSVDNQSSSMMGTQPSEELPAQVQEKEAVGNAFVRTTGFVSSATLRRTLSEKKKPTAFENPPISSEKGKSSGNSRAERSVNRPKSRELDAVFQRPSSGNGYGLGSAGSGTAGLNYRKFSIKSASSSANVTPSGKRRKSSKKSSSGGSAISA